MQILSVSMQTLSQQVSLLLGALRACSKRGACQMFGCISSPAMSCVNAPGGQWGVNGGGDKVKGVCERVHKTISGLRQNTLIMTIF